MLFAVMLKRQLKDCRLPARGRSQSRTLCSECRFRFAKHALVLAARACVCWDCHAMVTLDVAGSTSVQAIHDLHLLDRHDTQATLSSEQLPLCNAVKWCEESQRAQAICVITSDGIELKAVLRVRHKMPSTMWLVRCRRHACCCVSGEHSNAGLSKLQTSHCYHQQHAVC